MESSWSDEAQELRRAAEEFGTSLNDDLEERDRLGRFDRSLWSRCAEFGILGLAIPERYGGTDQELPAVVHALEGLGYGCRDNGLLFGLGAQLWSVELPILLFGTEEQQERYLPGLVDGRLIGAHAVTESEAGSDAFALHTTARLRRRRVRARRRQDLHHERSGRRPLPRRRDARPVGRVERSDGVPRRARHARLRGVRAKREDGTADVDDGRARALSGCRIPARPAARTPGGGSAVFGAAMEWERSFILAPALGTMRRQLKECLAYARTRRQFGEPIGKREPVAAKLVDMQPPPGASQLLTYRAAWRKQDGKRLTYEPSQVKLQLSESWVQTSQDALQIHGASGYMVELGIERDLRDALASRIYSGTSEIQRLIIAGFLGL